MKNAGNLWRSQGSKPKSWSEMTWVPLPIEFLLGSTNVTKKTEVETGRAVNYLMGVSYERYGVF